MTNKELIGILSKFHPNEEVCVQKNGALVDVKDIDFHHFFIDADEVLWDLKKDQEMTEYLQHHDAKIGKALVIS